MDSERINKLLKKTYNEVKSVKDGKNADYIPELAKVNPNIFGISIMDCSGNLFNIGDHKTTVAIESISKLFSAAKVASDKGFDTLLKKIGVNGSFLPFNSILATELAPDHTINPFLNQGAMATTSILYKPNKKAYFDVILNNLSDYANRRLTVSNKIYKSESENNERNMALAYLLKSYKRFYGPVPDCVDIYTKQCSVEVSSDDLANMASVFANNGIHPKSKKKLLSCSDSRELTRMLKSGGLYQFSGLWATRTGVASKSGVGGGILIIVPGICGIGLVSPPLDKIGNSVKGIKAGTKIVKEITNPDSCLIIKHKSRKNKSRKHKSRKKKSRKNNSR